jgi:CRISPR-associated protein Cmr2
MPYIYVVQIGPVQSFIAQARRVQDLLVGSKTLSHIAGNLFDVVKDTQGFQAILPDAKRSDAPHKLIFVSAESPDTLGQKIEDSVQDCWERDFAIPVYEYVRELIGKGDWQAVFERQAFAKWLEIYWVATEFDVKDYAKSYKKANEAFGQRKQLRHFVQIEEPDWKCTLTGAESALPIHWNKLRSAIQGNADMLIRDNEKLGSKALIKRLISNANGFLGEDFKNFPSTRNIAADNLKLKDDEKDFEGKDVRSYLAVLHMDGDRIGATLGNIRDLSTHQQFSTALGQFASSVGEIVSGYGESRLIYAGGDDVLALLPLKYVLTCSNKIRQKFENTMKPFTYTVDGEIMSPTMSAGIAITPATFPLDRAIELARKAETSAKDDYGRNALVITEAHSSGQMRDAGAKWDDIVGLMSNAQQLFSDNKLSAKIGYELLDIAKNLAGDEKLSTLKPARKAELERLLKRRFGENATKEEKEDIISKFAPQIFEFAESDTHSWTDVAHWLVLARFLATGGKAGGN